MNVQAMVLTVVLLAGCGVAGGRVSVYGLKAIGTSQDIALSLQEFLESMLIRSGEYEVLSRADIDLILSEGKLQQSGACTDEACLVQTGAVLGVQKIITGTLSKVGSTYSLVLKVLDIASGRLESSASDRFSGTPEYLFDIGARLMVELLEPRTDTRDTVVREVVRTRVDTLTISVRDTVTVSDTVHVRDTLYTARPVALPDKEEQTHRDRAAQSAALAAQDTRRNRRIGVGALGILGSIAAGILAYQLAVR